MVLGAPGDRAAASTVLQACGDAAMDAVGIGGIGTMAALVEQCDLFVGNDSGPMHVAAAVGTATVAVFGPGAPGKTAPYVPAARRREVSRAFPCSPCRQEFFRECDAAPSGIPWCLETVTVQEVLDAAQELLAAT
jgi:ADP-heptose:LPS heptosyltransferase